MTDEEELVFWRTTDGPNFLKSKAALHIVYTATRFPAVKFLESLDECHGQSIDGIW